MPHPVFLCARVGVREVGSPPPHSPSETHYKKQCEELLALAQGIVRANVQISCEVMHYKQQLKAAGLPVTEVPSRPPALQRVGSCIGFHGTVLM